MIDLNGKVVLVTGGSRGIGAAIVRAITGAGGEVVLHYGRSRDRAEALADEVGAGRCRILAADLDDGAAVPGLWREAVAWKGRVDVLVNNAGIYLPAGVDADFDTWAEVWARTLRVNLVAAAHLCREAVRHFRERGGGAIVNVASRAAFRGDAPDYTHYAASKAGMVALTRTIARGFGAENITAFVVAPGFVRTDMAEDYFRDHGDYRVRLDATVLEKLILELRNIANSETRMWHTLTATPEKASRLRMYVIRTPDFETQASRCYLRGTLFRISGRESVNIDFSSDGGDLHQRDPVGHLIGHEHALVRDLQSVGQRVHSAEQILEFDAHTISFGFRTACRVLTIICGLSFNLPASFIIRIDSYSLRRSTC